MSDKLIKAVKRRDELFLELNKAKEKLPEYKKYLRAETSVEKAKKECSHPDDYTEDYIWHHGYGQYVNGAHCKLCGKYRAWKTMGEWKDERPYIVFDD
jgi:hypothetical protein